MSSNQTAVPAPSSSLIQAVQAGSREGWDRLVRIVTPAVRSWLMRRWVQSADADDICQEVLLTLARSIKDYDRSRPFAPWLFTVVQSRHIDALRRRGNRPRGEGGSEFLNMVQQVPAPQSEEEDFRLDLMREALEVVRGEVPEATWEAFRRLVLDEQPAADVAQALGLKRERVYQFAHMVRERIREMLGVSE